jgi:hypothetical protein
LMGLTLGMFYLKLVNTLLLMRKLFEV